jgi:hypothetical protein
MPRAIKILSATALLWFAGASSPVRTPLAAPTGAQAPQVAPAGAGHGPIVSVAIRY